MDVVPACGFAPDDFLCAGLEFHEADWAVAGDVFAVGGGSMGWRGSDGVGEGEGGLGEDKLEFGGEEGELVLEVFGGFEDVVEDVDDVFALVAFAVVGAGAGGEVGNGDVVDVAGCAGHGDGFGGCF